MNSRKQLEILINDSYDELVSLLKWFSLFGPIPTIIGGWAVYFYNSYFGSIDIDIVGPSRQGHFIDIIERYERAHRYEFIAKDQLGLEATSRKPVIQNGKKRFKLEFTLTTITQLPTYRDSIQLYRPNLNVKQIQEWTKTIIK